MEPTFCVTRWWWKWQTCVLRWRLFHCVPSDWSRFVLMFFFLQVVWMCQSLCYDVRHVYWLPMFVFDLFLYSGQFWPVKRHIEVHLIACYIIKIGQAYGPTFSFYIDNITPLCGTLALSMATGTLHCHPIPPHPDVLLECHYIRRTSYWLVDMTLFIWFLCSITMTLICMLSMANIL